MTVLTCGDFSDAKPKLVGAHVGFSGQIGFREIDKNGKDL
jgi:hypothetical protein